MLPSNATVYAVPESGDHPLVFGLEVAFALAIAISIVILRGAWFAEGFDAIIRFAVWALLALLIFPALVAGVVLSRLTGGAVALTPDAIYLEGPFGQWRRFGRMVNTIKPLGFHLLEHGFASQNKTVAWAVHMENLPIVYSLTRLAYPNIEGRAFIITSQHRDHEVLLSALQFDKDPSHVITSSSV